MVSQIKEWLNNKRINRLYKKACKALAKFDNAIGKDSKNLFLKELLNAVYGTKYMNALFRNEVSFGSILEKIKYDDTDSVNNEEICDNECEYCDWVTCPKEEAKDGE